MYVTQSPDKVFYATEWAILEIDKADRSPRFTTKVEGLSDVGISVLRYNADTRRLLVAYTNSNLDIYDPGSGEVINLPFIQQNINIIGDKRIYDLAFDNEFAYIACGFGVLKLNLERAEAIFTTYTNSPVLSIALYQNYLYAGTENGLYRLPADDPNPADFGRWQLMDETFGFDPDAPVNALAGWNNALYAGIGRALTRFDGQGLDTIATQSNRDVVYLTAEGAGLVIGWRDGTEQKGPIEYLESNGNRQEINAPCNALFPMYAIEDGAKRFWIADRSDDFRYLDLNTGQCDRFAYNSPLNHKSADLSIGFDGSVYVGTPGPNSGLSAPFIQDGIYAFKDGVWELWNYQTIPTLVDDEFSWVDLWRVCAHPTEDLLYAGSWVGGLVSFSNGDYSVKYTKNNSILQGAGAAGNTRTAIGGLAFDEEGNLWISNYNAGAPIAVLKPDGTLRNFSAAPNQGLLQVAVDQNGYKWFVLAFNNGVMAYDSGQDIDDPSDDRYKIFTTTNSALPTNTVNCVGVDLDGDVWVGTQQGVVSFECGSSVFENTCTGRRRIVTVDDFNGYLLETEDVRAIAVDGANRKWFGTNNGVFVQSPDGLEQVAYFTRTNSPLFDNTITDIAIDPKTGEAWIGTEKGLISVRSEATEGGKINTQSPYAYPNPVRPEYDGPIAIYGLARDANIKITDIAGNLVFEGEALGGQAVWNGRDYQGRRVSSGVYLVYATSKSTFDNPDAVITKVVILN